MVILGPVSMWDELQSENSSLLTVLPIILWSVDPTVEEVITVNAVYPYGRSPACMAQTVLTATIVAAIFINGINIPSMQNGKADHRGTIPVSLSIACNLVDQIS